MSTQYSGPIPQAGGEPTAAHAGARIVQWSPAGLAWDSQKIVFALQFFAAWSTVTLLLAWFVRPATETEPGNGGSVLALWFTWTFACLQLFLAGVARMVTAGVQEGHSAPRSAAWKFLLRHGTGVVLGGVGLATTIVMVLVGFVFVVRGLSSSSETGLMGALLTIPTFFALLLLLPLLWHSQFVSIVMGVENCGVLGATRRLAVRSPLEALRSLIDIINETIPQVIGSFVFCGFLAFTTFVLTTHEFSLEGLNREGLAGTVTWYSYSVIACLWAAYSATTIAAAFASQYYSQSGR